MTFTTLFPNAAQPNHGIFVANRLRETCARGEIAARVVAPVPFFPFPQRIFGRYATYARAPDREVVDGFQVLHPRFLSVPKIGMSQAPDRLMRGSVPAVARAIAETDARVIDAHYLYPDGVAAAELSRRTGLPLVLTARGSDVTQIAEFAGPRRRILEAAARAHIVVSVCQALQDRLAEIGVESQKLRVLRNGVDLSLFRPHDGAPARTGLGLTRKVLLSVGSLIPRKRHDIAISALPSLPGWELVIVGDGPLARRLAKLAEGLGVRDRVRFAGEIRHSELPAVYSAADVMCLTSEREGWANVLLESMACGTPVIATRAGGTAEVVTCPEAGRLMDALSADALVQALHALVAQGIDRRATRHYAEQFGWDWVAAENTALLQAAAASRA